ncbi:hypothetical protein OG763_31075 [Streptomyces sp. NBC_01230]|uniref:hypothetical protein n=1 Tax=unclassified Streptomyces TaxID=2593676 RepID=UPI002E15C43D|nr:hypothetical protein OG763_31075 [Streptomyces sp. NBC_01230]
MGPKWSATYGQLLLFAALLFGIFVMHTVGHPTEHHGPNAVVTMDSGPQGAHEVHGAGPAGHASGLPVTTGEGMPPIGVCLAVLGTWGVTLLTVWLMALRPADHLLRAAAAPLLRFLRSSSPPAMTAHGRSSVLRI